MVMQMDKTSVVTSYMLRCCRDQSDGLLTVYVRQVQSGEERYFHSLQDVMEYIQKQLETDEGS